MMLKPPALPQRRLSRARLFFSIVAAVSLALVAVLANWGFELRSMQKLAVQAGILSLALWPLLYGFVFHKLQPDIALKPDFLIFSALLCILLALLVVPQQISAGRWIIALAITSLSCMGVVTGLFTSQLSEKPYTPLQVLFSLALVGGLIGMGIFLFNSLSVRMYGDDFVYTLEREARGYWGAVTWFYMNWSGRVFSNFLVMGLGDWRWTTLAELLSILAATFFMLRAIVKGSQGLRIPAILALTFWIPFAVFSVIPDVYKSLYWIVSSVAVLPVMACIPIYVLLVVLGVKSNTKRLPWAVVATFLLSFMVATTHEAAVLGWLAAQVIVLVYTWFTNRSNRRLLVLLIAGILAATAGLLAEVLSPGNLLRGVAQHYTRTTSLVELLTGSAACYIKYLRSISMPGWLALLTVASLGWWVETGVRRNGKAALAALLITQFLSAACFVPGVYAMSSTIPLRTQLIPGAYLIYGIFLTGLLLPRPANTRLSYALCAALLILVSVAGLQNIRRFTPTIVPMQQYARDWDVRDWQARHSDAEVTRIPIPWEEYEQKITYIQEYYRNHRSVSE